MKPKLYTRTKEEWMAELAEQEHNLRTRPLYGVEGEIEDATPLPEELIAAASFICMGMIQRPYLNEPFNFYMSRFIDMSVEISLKAGDHYVIVTLDHEDGIAFYYGCDNNVSDGANHHYSTIKGQSPYRGDNYELARFTTFIVAWVFAPSLTEAQKAPMEAARLKQEQTEGQSLNLSAFQAKRVIEELNTTTTHAWHNRLKNAARHFLAQNSTYWAGQENIWKRIERMRSMDAAHIGVSFESRRALIEELAQSERILLSERDMDKLLAELDGPPRPPSEPLKKDAQQHLADTLAQLNAKQFSE